MTASPWVKRKVAQMLEILRPAPDGATWPCGHPKTEANSQPVGSAGLRCRVCRRKLARENWQRTHGEGA
jgi:hypothetical protein